MNYLYYVAIIPAFFLILLEAVLVIRQKKESILYLLIIVTYTILCITFLYFMPIIDKNMSTEQFLDIVLVIVLSISMVSIAISKLFFLKEILTVKIAVEKISMLISFVFAMFWWFLPPGSENIPMFVIIYFFIFAILFQKKEQKE